MERYSIEYARSTCSRCRDICRAAISECVGEVGQRGETTFLRAVIDCAAASITALDMMQYGPEWYQKACRHCAAACRKCADFFHEADGTDMRQRADVCTECAEVCESLAELGELPSSRERQTRISGTAFGPQSVRSADCEDRVYVSRLPLR